MTIKLVCFDFADTIARLEPSKEFVLQRFIIEKTGILIPLGKIAEAYRYLNNLFFYSSVDIKRKEDKLSFYIEYNNKLLSLLGLSHLESLSGDSFYHYFRENKQHWQLKPGVTETLDWLRKQGFILALVSNFDAVLDSLLEVMGVRNKFDSVFISQLAGLEKPNSAFLALPLQHHNVKPAEAIFIGDSYHLDYVPAYRLGMKAYLLDEGEHYVDNSAIKKINSIAQIKNILMEQ